MKSYGRNADSVKRIRYFACGSSPVWQAVSTFIAPRRLTPAVGSHRIPFKLATPDLQFAAQPGGTVESKSMRRFGST